MLANSKFLSDFTTFFVLVVLFVSCKLAAEIVLVIASNDHTEEVTVSPFEAYSFAPTKEAKLMFVSNLIVEAGAKSFMSAYITTGTVPSIETVHSNVIYHVQTVSSALTDNNEFPIFA
jgi:hypothetical protein